MKQEAKEKLLQGTYRIFRAISQGRKADRKAPWHICRSDILYKSYCGLPAVFPDRVQDVVGPLNICDKCGSTFEAFLETRTAKDEAKARRNRVRERYVREVELPSSVEMAKMRLQEKQAAYEAVKAELNRPDPYGIGLEAMWKARQERDQALAFLESLERELEKRLRMPL